MNSKNILITIITIAAIFFCFFTANHFQRSASAAEPTIHQEITPTNNRIEIEADLKFIKTIQPILQNPHHPLYRQVYEAVYEKPPK